MTFRDLPIKSFANFEIQVTVDENLPDGHRGIVIYLFGSLAQELGWRKKNLSCKLKKKNGTLSWVPMRKEHSGIQYIVPHGEMLQYEMSIRERKIRIFKVTGITQWKSKPVSPPKHE